MSKKAERLERIASFLRAKHWATVKDISLHTGVSEMTVRRDLHELKDKNIAHFTSGVAIYNAQQGAAGVPAPAGADASGQGPYELASEKLVNNAKKSRIGQAAAELVDDGEIVIIDTGTTTEHIARHIPDDKDLTVLCYNINILNELLSRPRVNLLFAGGVYHANTQMFESPEGIALINRTRATKVFLSAAGVSEQLGLTCVNQYEVAVRRAIINTALTRILLVDSTKFDRIRPAFFAALNEVDVIVTDDGIPEQWIATIEKHDIKLHIVGNP